MPRNNLKPKDLVGLSIYQDPKKGTIWYDSITKRAFVITNSDVKTYMIYTSMFSVCILAAFAAMSIFSLNYVDALIVFVVLLILSMILFRIFYFYKLTEIEGYKPPKRDDIVTAMANNYSRTRLIVLILLLLALAILMPLYAINEKMSDINRYGSFALSGLTVIGIIISLLALIKQQKNSK
ncbi:MAG: hypothetical protein IJL85_01780 [Erysipelotrichaceae bacterium]|nr:hypothetical protein [Erysipelotrichaceae bacterium]